MNVSFISPITPQDLKRQSLVFMYLHVSVQSIDNQRHVVELYSDTSAGEPMRIKAVFMRDD